MTRQADEALTPLLLSIAREVSTPYYDLNRTHSAEDLEQIALLSGWELVVRGLAEEGAIREAMNRALLIATQRGRFDSYRRANGSLADAPAPEPSTPETNPRMDALGRAMRRLPDLEYQIIAGIFLGMAPMTVGLRLRLSMQMTAHLLTMGRRRLSEFMEAEERGQAA